MMWLILLRMIATLLCGVIGGAAVLILIGIGNTKEAVRWGIIAAIVVWFVQPNAEDRAAFAEFQKSREPWTPPPR